MWQVPYDITNKCSAKSPTERRQNLVQCYFEVESMPCPGRIHAASMSNSTPSRPRIRCRMPRAEFTPEAGNADRWIYSSIPGRSTIHRYTSIADRLDFAKAFPAVRKRAAPDVASRLRRPASAGWMDGRAWYPQNSAKIGRLGK